MKRLFFARHGLSEMNLEGVYSGQIETPLTEKGRFQAKQAGRRAKEAGLNFDMIISSPLSRAHETARIIADELGISHEKLVLHESLKERNYGELEGRRYKDPHKMNTDNPFLLDQIPGIETVSDLHIRAKEFLDWLEDLEHDSILLVSHGAIGRAIRRLIENKELHEPVNKFHNAVIEQLI